MAGEQSKKPEEAGRLAGHLTPEQAKELAANDYITVDGADGYRYRLLHEPYGHTTYQLGHDGTPIASWCTAQYNASRYAHADPDEAVLERKLLIESAGEKALPARFKSVLDRCRCPACQTASEAAGATARAYITATTTNGTTTTAYNTPATDDNAVTWRWADGTVRQQRR